MATFTIRATEDQEEALNEFMVTCGHNTKSKAILWLIENGQHLNESNNRLNAITESYERIAQEKRLISEMLSLD